MAARNIRVVLVTGGRDYADRQKVFSALDGVLNRYGAFTLLHGAAPGVDSLAQDWADEHPEVECFPVPAWWDRYKKSAGPIRNAELIALAVKLAQGGEVGVLAFPGKNGTADMKRKCRSAGLLVREVDAA